MYLLPIFGLSGMPVKTHLFSILRLSKKFIYQENYKFDLLRNKIFYQMVFIEKATILNENLIK